MGFFDRFTKTLNDWDFRWGEAGENLGSSWDATRELLLKNRFAPFGSLWMTAFGTEDQKAELDAYYGSRSFMEQTFDTIGLAGEAAGGVFGAIGSQPVARQVFAFADAAQRELVGRPIATVNLVRADAVNERNLGLFFDSETWKNAYNTTTYVTPGQAFTYALLANEQVALEELGILDLNAEQRKDLLERFPTLGIIIQDPKEFDPRIRDGGRREYYDNHLMRGVSGTLDLGIVLFGDPTVIGGKFAGLAKLRYISNEMNAAAIQSGRLEGHVTSAAYRDAKRFVEEADNNEVVRRRMFNNHYDGDLISAVLFDAAHAQKRYEESGGVVDLYDTTFRALYGEVNAWNTITQEAPRIADAVGHERAVYTIANAAQNYGLGDLKANAKIDDLMESKHEAWVDATINGHGMWGKIEEAPLVGQAVPRLRATSAWRTGVHSFLRNKVPVTAGHWARRAAYLLPSQRSGRMLDLNDPNSVAVFRSTFSMSRLSQAELDRWVGAYSRATSPEGRFYIYNAAENYVFKQHAQAYNLTGKQLDDLTPAMNRFRKGNRQILAANRRFASEDVQKQYEKKLVENRLRSAQQLATLRHDIDEAVKRGEYPDSYFDLPDEFGNLTLIPKDMNLRLDQPITLTQHADIVPMVDWNVLENALWWHVGLGRGKPAAFGGEINPRLAAVGRTGYAAQDLTRAGLEAVMSVWKVAAILRPGYVWRTLSDELGRVFALQRFTTLSPMGRAAGYISHNMSVRGRNLGEMLSRRVAVARARRQAVEVDAEVVAAGTPMELPVAARLTTDTATNPAGLNDGDLNYATIEAAFGDGVLGVDDYLGRVEAMGEAGVLPGPLAEIWTGYQARTAPDPERLFRRHAVDYALRTVGRGAYTSPAWQRSVIRLAERVRARKPHGEPGRGSLIDPFTGESPDLTRTQIDNFVEVTRRHEIRADEEGFFHGDHLYDFIADNVDELLKPNNMLHFQLTPGGNISLGVGRAFHPQLPPVKPTGGVRVKLPWTKKDRDGLRDSGMADIAITTSAGRITVGGAFQGGEGARFAQQASNRGPEEAWVDTITDIEYARFVANSRRWVDIGPDDWNNYGASWARAVNKQLGSDAVAQQFLQGKSYNDVLLWMFNTSEGRAYHFRMGPLRKQFAEQVAMVQSMVDTYMPVNPQRQGESLRLREKAMAGEATIDDLEAVVPRSQMPKVHGASLEYATGRGPIMDGIKRLTDKTFKAISDLPNDKFVRFPFAEERYRLHVRGIAEARGVGKAQAGQQFTTTDLRKIEQAARRRALRDVQRYLFQVNSTWDLAKAARLFVPFGSALSDSMLKWGLVLREHPAAALQVWKIWNAPERAGMVTDQDGNELAVEEGEEIWYSVNPETGERTRLPDHQAKDRFITFRLPSFLSERFYGGDVRPQVRVNKRVFQTFLDLPTAGPIVAVPANKFALDNPEFAENRFVKQWILPLGPSANSSSILIPSNVQNLRRTVFPRWAAQDRQAAEAQGVAIFAAEMTSYSLGQRPNPPTFEEAREKAAAMRGIRFWSTFAGVSPQIQSPYQPYVDYYRQLRVQEASLRAQAAKEGRDQAEVPAADQLFYEQMGTEFFALTARVTRNALGIPATLQTHRAYKKYQDLIDKHPDIATLIIGEEGAGEFSRAVYEAQKLAELRPGAVERQRQRLSMEESWEDQQRRRGWIEYGKFQDLVTNDLIRLGLNDVRQAGAERVKAARDKWIQERTFVESPWGGTVVNPWFEDFRSIDTSRMTQRLNSFRDIVQDPRLLGRDEIRGLAHYLQLRDRFRGVMDQQGWATLANEDAAVLRVEWQRMVFRLREQSLSFSALHDRWLSGDELLEAR